MRTLLIHGDNDPSTPIRNDSAHNRPTDPGCQLKVYEGAAHELPITLADQPNAYLMAFTKS